MVEEGKQAPDFELTSDAGESVRLSDLRGKQVVLYFYPKDDTPGCTAQACGIRDVYGEFVREGAVVLGVSPDSERSHVKFKEKFDLPFTLLADEGHRVADEYGVWAEKKYLGKTFWGVNRSTARARRRSASTSRSRGDAVVTSASSSSRVVLATASTARSNEASFACDGFCMPLTLRTYCTAAAWISSSVVGGSKL